jgi:hypothetical protein
MQYRASLLILLLSFGLTACSSKPKYEKGGEIFTTDIRSNGAKRFVFAMIYPTNKRSAGKSEGKRPEKRGDDSGRSGRKKGARGQSDHKRDGNNDKKQQHNEYITDDEKRQAIMTLLDKKMLETSYCRAGHIELNYSQSLERTELTGECVESATAQDKLRWK